MEKVDLMPPVLEPGIVYFSDEFEIAIHLCACGCGEKIKTPIGPVEWNISDTSDGPTLYPSIGNWQQPCQSHYFIRNGRVIWMPKWTSEEVQQGRAHEANRRSSYYESLDRVPQRRFRRVWNFIVRKLLQLFRNRGE